MRNSNEYVYLCIEASCQYVRMRDGEFLRVEIDRENERNKDFLFRYNTYNCNIFGTTDGNQGS